VNEEAGEEEVSEGREGLVEEEEEEEGRGMEEWLEVTGREASRELARGKEREKEKNDTNEEAGEEEASKRRESLVDIGRGRGRGGRGGTRNSYEPGREETRVTIMRRGGKQVEGKFGGCHKGKGRRDRALDDQGMGDTTRTGQSALTFIKVFLSIEARRPMKEKRKELLE
jgi:hypothetical protein